MEARIINFTNDCEANTKAAQKRFEQTPEEIENLKNELSVLGIPIIETYKQFSEVVGLTANHSSSDENLLLDFDFNPQVKKETIVIFDNADFNSTYLLGMFNTAMEDWINKTRGKATYEKTIEDLKEKFDIYYCNNPYLRLIMFNPFLTNPIKRPDLDLTLAQRDNLQPNILNISLNSDCRVVSETFMGVITEEQIWLGIGEMCGFDTLDIVEE